MDTRSSLTFDDFLGDTHASKYRDQLDGHPSAFRVVFQVINDSANEQRLLDAEAHGLPALAGVARFLEADPLVATVLKGRDANRFKQTIGVLIRVKMAKLGWRTTGRKGPVRGSAHFSKAERYERDRDGSNFEDYRTRALAILDEVGRLGTEIERTETDKTLREALASTRAAEGRPF
ncbi:hypothetical protein BH23ACT9_BH23ACT9_30110 [soil metagenome]